MNRPHSIAAMPARPRLERLEGGCLRAWAPAKINLNLLVGPRRPDGYHGLDSLVAKVTLYDHIDLALRADNATRFSCNGADCGPDDDNLVLKAAYVLAGAAPWKSRGGQIDLYKSIPPGKGLGGGSSDAAAAMIGLSELWQALPDGELARLSPSLGSDVPLFFGAPASRMTGRGEMLAPIEVHPFVAVLILPACECSTAAVYRAFDEAANRAGAPNPAAIGEQIDPEVLPLPGAMPLRVFEEGHVPGDTSKAAIGDQIALEVLRRPPSQWRSLLRNDLGPAARTVSPELAGLWDSLSAAVPAPVCLTGSGSALFVLCDDEAEAAALLPAIRPICNCVVVRNNPW